MEKNIVSGFLWAVGKPLVELMAGQRAVNPFSNY